MVATSAGTRFIAAFNDIEGHLRSVLHADIHEEFGSLVRKFAARKYLNREQEDALRAYGDLRNAISHGRYYHGRPIADPVEPVVTEIERLRALLLNPPTVLSVLGTQIIKSVKPNDDLGVALAYVKRFDFSQLPVYDDAGACLGLLTTNAIARWLADQLTINEGLAATASVLEVMKFTEPHEIARFVPRTIVAFDAIRLLSEGGVSGGPVSALIVTQTGKANERPMAIAVGADFSRLSAALSFQVR